MKNSFVVMMVLCAANALAMPTKEELAKAQSLVVELMADDVAAYKAKSKKAEEVGDVSVKYAQEASTEAAKFLLLKGAISYYVRGESYDKAADAVNALREAVPDVPPDVLEEVIRKNTARVTAKKAPRLYAMYQTVQVQVAAAKEVRAAKAALAKKPKDEAAIRKLAEAQALSGDWKSALGTFAQMGNKAGAMAKSETDGKDLAAVADFWWAYESYLGEDDADAFKAHAAAIYRQCLADGSIDGLKKNIVEKRIKGYDEGCGIKDLTPTIGTKKDGSDAIELRIVGADPIRLIKCPAGAFKRIGSRNAAFVTHDVVLTRPYWMSEAPITIGQYTAVMGSFDVLFEPRFGIKPRDAMRKLADAMGGKACAISGVTVEEIDSYCEKLLTKFKRSIPQGYIVRLPTEAEWIYAFKCGGHVKEQNYAALAEGAEAPNYREIGIDYRDVLVKTIADLGISYPQDKISQISFYTPRYRVKTCKPNDWGFYDMAGFCWERLADRVSSSYAGSATWNKKGAGCFAELNKAFVAGENRDPLLVTVEKPGQTLSIRCDQKNWGKWVNESERCWDVGFRLVIGPDLVSEWKAKSAKK